MNNTKTLLREEINLSNKKMLLSEQSLALIGDSQYVKHVLGIEIPLVEYYSFETRKKIIEEQIKMQDVLTNAAKLSGIATFTVNIVNSIKNLKDIATLVKDLILSPDLMAQATEALGGVCRDLSSKVLGFVTWIKTNVRVAIDGFTGLFEPMLEHVSQTLLSLANKTGWLGFLSMLGFCVYVEYLYQAVFVKILQKGVEYISKGVDFLFNGTNEVLNMFKGFSEFIVNALDISKIVDFFGGILRSTIYKKTKFAFSIIGTIAIILAPVIKKLYWTKALQKK
jgi:hypothetical protein